MTFRVSLTNTQGWRLTLIVPGASDRDACERAEKAANTDPEHAPSGPWASGFSTRAS